MTLVLENAIRAFDPATATLATPDEASLARDDPVEFSLATIYRFARHYDTLTPPEEPEWTCLPLHHPESARLTGEYVAYTDHAVHDEIIVYGTGDTNEAGGTGDSDERDFQTVERFARSPLARRLRYWHPDCVPDTDPPYYEAPFADREPPTKQIDPETFFDGLAEYLADERRAAIERRVEERRDAAPSERFAAGDDAIPALRAAQVFDDGEIAFEIEFDAVDTTERAARRRGRFVQEAFGIYENDPVLLHAPDGTSGDFPVRATVTDVATTRVTLAPDWSETTRPGVTRRSISRGDDGFGVTKLLNPLPYDRRADAIAELRSDDTFREVLTGNRDLTFTQPRVADSSPHDTALNQEQRAAVRYALLADDLFCLHGPPGTGKTRTLVEITRRAVEAGDRVLVCADSNQAVDNLVIGESTPSDPDSGSLHAYGQHGTEEFRLDRRNVRRSNREVVGEWYGDSPANPQVVAATNGSAARIDGRFDLVVIDEATQATTVTSAIPLTAADTAVLAGDHRQLPPFSRTESSPAGTAGLSLFEHLYDDGGVFENVGLQLRTQYRMHREIAYFPNRRFYDRRLRTGIDRRTVGDRPPIVGYDIGGGERTRGTSYANPAEARLVVRVLERLREDGVSFDEIGVVTPYAAQVTEISDRVASAFPTESRQVTIDTIDAFQGSERTVTVLSLVRSNPEGRIGFLGRPADGPRRLNVALTRARRLCVVIGDWATMRTPPETDDASELYADLDSYLRDTGRMRSVAPELL